MIIVVSSVSNLGGKPEEMGVLKAFEAFVFRFETEKVFLNRVLIFCEFYQNLSFFIYGLMSVLKIMISTAEHKDPLLL